MIRLSIPFIQVCLKKKIIEIRGKEIERKKERERRDEVREGGGETDRQSGKGGGGGGGGGRKNKTSFIYLHYSSRGFLWNMFK